MIDYRPNPYGYGCITGSADEIHAAGMLTINKHSYDGVKLLEADGLRIMRGSKFGMRAKRDNGGPKCQIAIDLSERYARRLSRSIKLGSDMGLSVFNDCPMPLTEAIAVKCLHKTMEQGTSSQYAACNNAARGVIYRAFGGITSSVDINTLYLSKGKITQLNKGQMVALFDLRPVESREVCGYY
mgnify:CR=1 FL=1